MKRAGIAIIGAILLLCAAIMAGAAPMKVQDSKHNLSAPDSPIPATPGPGPIQSEYLASGGTSEICVFCHTPHSGTAEAPLWNRSNVGINVTEYQSDVMTALSYTAGDASLGSGALHAKTRICLSCHDGTIALGSLVNVPNSLSDAPIPMLGTTGAVPTHAMPPSAAGYLGRDLRDDHPVAVKHNPGSSAGQDPELKTLGGTDKVRLYTSAGVATKNNGDYVECTSCHDAHDNQYGKFMIDAYVGSDSMGSNLCRTCHDKAGDDSTAANESVHSNNANYSISYTTTTRGGTVQKVKCMVCHYPHKAGLTVYNGNTPNPGAGKYLLTYQEEMTCFNNTNRWGEGTTVCHGSTALSKRIDNQVSKSYAHKVGNYSAVSAKPHNASEGNSVSGSGTGWLGVAGNSWHVECDDCHNSHTAGKLLHTAGSNTVASTLAIYGAGGAEPPASYTAWSVPAASAYTYVEPIGVLRISGSNLGVTKEYQICLKCHSSFAWGSSGPGSVSTPNLTDQALEFNPNNASYHPVISSNSNTFGTYYAPWTNGSQTMYCSDCHGNDNGAEPQGPHGSGTPYVLIKSFDDAYLTPRGTAPSTTDLCALCHNTTVYVTGLATQTGTGFMTTAGTNLHTQHKLRSDPAGTGLYSYRCVNCHAKIPHGVNRKGMIVAGGDPAAYYPLTGPTITGFNGGALPASASYGTTTGANCYTVNGCHQ